MLQKQALSPLCRLLTVEHYDVLNICPEGEPMMSCDECGDSAADESLLETKPIQSPLQVFAGMGGLALIAERLPMLYPDVIQQVRHSSSSCEVGVMGFEFVFFSLLSCWTGRRQRLESRPCFC